MNDIIMQIVREVGLAHFSLASSPAVDNIERIENNSL